VEERRNKKMSFFDQLKTSNIRFNPRPWLTSNSFNEPEKTVIFSEDNLDRLHVEVVKKVDKLLASLDEKGNEEASTDEPSTKMKTE